MISTVTTITCDCCGKNIGTEDKYLRVFCHGVNNVTSYGEGYIGEETFAYCPDCVRYFYDAVGFAPKIADTLR